MEGGGGAGKGIASSFLGQVTGGVAGYCLIIAGGVLPNNCRVTGGSCSNLKDKWACVCACERLHVCLAVDKLQESFLAYHVQVGDED